MSAVHGAGLLHRDIKAQNVMRSEDGRIALMDFGTGRKLDEDASLDLAGTPLYLAPEVLLGQQATTRSDLYSLGVVLFRLVTGSYPVQGRTVREIRGAHERGQRTAVRAVRPDVPPKLARIIERAIDPRPERRYESADALGAELAALMPRPKIVRLASAAGVAAAVILVVGAGWEMWPSGRILEDAQRTAHGLYSAERPVIAVLPFKNLSAEPDSDYFVEGLRGEIIRDLALVQGLQVLSSTSSFTSKDQPRNLRHIGERLGANLIVEGSVLRAGRRLRIHAQLVQVASGAPVWAEQFDRELEDIFRIQDEISRAIVNKLRLTLDRDRRRQDTNAGHVRLVLEGARARRSEWRSKRADGR